ncbi:hypothetical protein WKI71_01220 [Streptomyces sp. MS1.AVA.1]|uniref:Uncharacterized protein n=1 Tax=Streptomyces machairae TaxID=3134109 RepID=A0ABU8UFJ4_9ACTN
MSACRRTRRYQALRRPKAERTYAFPSTTTTQTVLADHRPSACRTRKSISAASMTVFMDPPSPCLALPTRRWSSPT